MTSQDLARKVTREMYEAWSEHAQLHPRSSQSAHGFENEDLQKAYDLLYRAGERRPEATKTEETKCYFCGCCEAGHERNEHCSGGPYRKEVRAILSNNAGSAPIIVPNEVTSAGGG